MSHKSTTVAVLGIGRMGLPMAKRLCVAGYRVQVWNRTRAKAEPLAADGAVVADSAAEAVAAADVVITLLENGPVVEAVLFDSDIAYRPGQVVIDMSSIAPDMARDHAVRLEREGVQHIDAPVSGGTVGAKAGTLAIMAGGAVETIEAQRSLIETFGRLTRVGDHGAGQVAKLANQAIVGATIGAVAEALTLAKAGGADPAAVRDAIRGGFAESRILELHGERMVTRDFTAHATVSVQAKDMGMIGDLARSLNLDLPVLADIEARFMRLRDELDGAALDHAGLLIEVEDRQPKSSR
ncbi:MAG: NAD(P)-dependent oxidoreductase [Pseudomonadota bacterium]